MEQYETLFSRVYQDLKGRIVTGQLPAGSDFPSIQRLRQEYQIGFRTAKEVTVRLREDGYIASRDRKPPQVCWEGGMPAALAVLSHRGHLSELYDALAVVMPLLSSFASQTCDMRLLPCYEQTKRAMHRGIKPHEWGLMPRLCRELFQRAETLCFLKSMPALTGIATCRFSLRVTTPHFSRKWTGMGIFSRPWKTGTSRKNTTG